MSSVIAGRGVDPEVDEQLGSEGLTQLDVGGERRDVLVGALLERVVLHLLGTDADDDVTVDEVGEPGSGVEQRRSEVERLRAELHGEASAIGAQQPTLEEVHRR